MLTKGRQRKEGNSKELGWGILFPLMARSNLIDKPRQAPKDRALYANTLMND